jgi:hypothetical protein
MEVVHGGGERPDRDALTQHPGDQRMVRVRVRGVGRGALTSGGHEHLREEAEDPAPGTALSRDRGRTKAIGYFLHFAFGEAFALVYYAILSVINTAAGS